jgi:O-antigen ligase
MNLEAGIICLLLLLSIGVFAFPIPEKLMNGASYGVLAFLITWRWKRCIYVATRDIPLLLLLVTAVASIFWSAAPDSTINEIKTLLRGTLLGVYLAARYTIEELAQLFVWLFGIGTFLGLAGYLSSSLRGFLGYKNSIATVATLAAMLFLMIAIDKHKHRWVGLVGFSMAMTLNLISLSKSGLSAFLILVSLYPLSNLVKHHYKLRIVFFITALLLGSIAFVLILNNLEFIVVDKLGKDLDFNGRIPIWKLIFEKGLERPWLGYGYVGFWTSEAGLFVVYNSWASEGEDAAIGNRFNSHNGFLDLFVQLGAVGFSLYILSLMTLLLRITSLFFKSKKLELFAILQIVFSFVFFSLSDSVNGMILTPSPFWTIYVAIALSTRLYYNRCISHSFSKQ